MVQTFASFMNLLLPSGDAFTNEAIDWGKTVIFTMCGFAPHVTASSLWMGKHRIRSDCYRGSFAMIDSCLENHWEFIMSNSLTEPLQISRISPKMSWTQHCLWTKEVILEN